MLRYYGGLLMALSGTGITAASGNGDASFRAPAIPLFTTDPFMQTWLRGDTSTAGTVTHWDGTDKTTEILLRIHDGADAEVYQLLGQCQAAEPVVPGPAQALGKGHDVSPGSCDIVNFHGLDENECNRKCYGTTGCLAYVLYTPAIGDDICYLKSCSSPVVPSANHKAAWLIDPTKRNCTASIKSATQKAVHILPTRTLFELDIDSALAGHLPVNLTLLSTMFADDYIRLSRPVYYADISIGSTSLNADVFVAFSAEHAVNTKSQNVTWEPLAASATGVKIGNSEQKVLGSKGDRVNIDWGYLHMLPNGEGATAYAGSLTQARSKFAESSGLPSTPDSRVPRAVDDDLPAIAVASPIGVSGHYTAIVAYDDVKSINYFGDAFAGYWTQTYDNITHAMEAASAEFDEMLAKSESHDANLLEQLENAGGPEYAQLCALSYRQTLAAQKLVWNTNRSIMWNFLKEISTNGDMQTMDVIYPASPMMLYTNPELLRLLLEPVLAYANNETYVRFGNPYSPHQLGTYPIGDSPTSAQEPMPLENTGNMFFMILGLLREQKGDVSWFYPRYWPMLTSWADELILTAEFPAYQLCTDDFTGRLANNTNLGAKGIVALEVFAEICRLTGDSNTNCSHYSATANEFAAVWQKYAFAADPAPHYKMSYNKVEGVTDSWSIKYNLLWQKMLKLDGPFPWDEIVNQELSYYATKQNEFGVPLDPRHDYVKTDWLSWVAAMASLVDQPGANITFRNFFHPIFLSVNTTEDRNPFTDLYDTSTAHQDRAAFIARPVIGGLFAQALAVR